MLGIEHILGGIDHLLFVLGLLLIVRNRWLLVQAITAFTLAHSVTLAAATLGWVHVPQPPVEAVIALRNPIPGERTGETAPRSRRAHGTLPVDRSVHLRTAPRLRLRG